MDLPVEQVLIARAVPVSDHRWTNTRYESFVDENPWGGNKPGVFK